MISIQTAIDILSDERDSGLLHNSYNGEYAEAMSMAIEALKSQIEPQRIKLDKPIFEFETKVEFCGGMPLLKVISD